jgi:uncharacterized membrane-anchored protein
MRKITVVPALLVWAALSCAAFADDPAPRLTPQLQARIAKLRKIAASLRPQRGDVALKSADATLHLGTAYYFLPAVEARSILVDAWDNPPDSVVGVQGLIFPMGKSFLDDTWAAVIEFEPTGYVSDSDARTTDYQAMLKNVQDGEPDVNAARKSRGYPPMHLVGWAQPPYYDQRHHTLVWARDIHVGDAKMDSLNYDLRALGRRGVLSMNIIDAMSKLAEVRGAAANLQNVATFNGGARYEDYRAGSDKLAEYGVGGLVAAGLGVLAAKKVGLLALGLIFAKKFIALILAGLAGIGAWFRRVFAGRKAAASAAGPTIPPPAA